jgi:hypothetical protein
MKLPQDITKKQQQILRESLNKCHKVINPTFKWKYVNMSPKDPLIHSLIKLHKQNRPLRPIVNWKGSPGYKISEHINAY